MKRTRAKRTAHSDLVKAAVTWLSLQGAYVWVNNTGRLPDRTGRFVRFGFPGSADIIGVLPGGRFIGAEAKVPPDTARQDQIEWADGVRARGGYACVFHDLYELETHYREATNGVIDSVNDGC